MSPFDLRIVFALVGAACLPKVPLPDAAPTAGQGPRSVHGAPASGDTAAPANPTRPRHGKRAADRTHQAPRP